MSGIQDKYRELFVEADMLKNDLDYIMTKWSQTFGEYETKSARLELSTGKKMKYATYLKDCKEKGIKPEGARVKASIEAELYPMYKHVEEKEEINKQLAGQQLPMPILPKPSDEVKELYIKIAKNLHPAVNEKVADNAAFEDLWHQVVIAYWYNNLNQLKVLDLHYNLAADTANVGEEEDVAGVEEKINDLKKSIEDMKKSPLNQYRDVIDDSSVLNDMKNQMIININRYNNYDRNMDKIIADLEK